MTNKTYKDKCLRCGTVVYDAYWEYIWKGNSGYCCKSCGESIHRLGYALQDHAAQLLEDEGIQVVENKEKFGEFRLVAIIKNSKKHEEFITNLYENYKKNFSEFAWDWRWF